MLALQVFLTLGGIIFLVNAFRIETPKAAENATLLTSPGNASANPTASAAIPPMVVLVDETDLKDESLILELVYRGKSKNPKKDVYSIVKSDFDKNIIKLDHEDNFTTSIAKKLLSASKNSTAKLKDNAKADSTNSRNVEDRNVPQIKTTYEGSPEWALQPEEISPLTGYWPKYAREMHHVQPFPELTHKEYQKKNSEMKHDKAPISQAHNTNSKVQIPQEAGPMLHPLSIFDREFNVPFFQER